MHKKILILICVCLLSVGATGCNYESHESYESSENKELPFTTVVESSGWIIVYHNETKVMYIANKYGEFTLLVNEDGSPMVWEEKQ